VRARPRLATLDSDGHAPAIYRNYVALTKKGRRAKAAESAKDARIAKLEAVVALKDAKIAQKNEVISELMEENIAAKKASGEP
jgi:hypothetical protein